MSLLASGEGFQAPGPIDFVFSGNVAVWKSTWLLVLAAVIVFAFFSATSRKAAVVPSKSQYLGEQAYLFVRNGIAQDSIGANYAKYVPLLVTLFFFLLVNNLFGMVPLIQFAPFSHVGFAYGLAVLVWVVYNGVGVAKHGPVGYMKHATVPSGVPVAILPLLIPLEFLSNILVRPVTLSLRLFANMFAGHLLIILFSLGAEYLLIDATGSILVKPAGVASFVIGFLVGFLELVVAGLQAYVFTLLTAQYIAGAQAAHH